MKFAISYGMVMVWLSYLISSGIVLFWRGFLLSRISKSNVNNCNITFSLNPNSKYYLSEDTAGEIFNDVNATLNICLPQKSKVIVLVVDALKYEFGLYKENAPGEQPYENKLDVINEMLTTMPEQTRFMKFKADPPTTTLQRLKGLTTGTLPTFVDIGSNFATPAINEDNIIDQMIRNHLSVVFLGDSTWVDLYPQRFKRSYAYPSFDIYDLDAVDYNILKHLDKEIAKDDWQVLIAHFLGVDHCGHRYGPFHKEMERKLTEMNSMIRNVIKQMDNSTTLIVIGDHGMTASGDHGGETDDEINALLFAYTKQTKFLSKQFGSNNEIMQQIDLVPTLAAILGIPIPYSNLGLINFNLIPDISLPYANKYQWVLLHAWQNAKQVYTYFHNYTLENRGAFNKGLMERLNIEFILLSHRVKSIYSEAAFQSFITDLNVYMRQILDVCRSIWIKFDANLMSQGLIITFIPIFFIYIFINNIPPSYYGNVFKLKDMCYTYLLNISAAYIGSSYYKAFAFKSKEHGIILATNVISALLLILYSVRNWPMITDNWSMTKKFKNLPTRLMLLIMFGIYFSNSFIIEEANILAYLLTSILLWMLIELWHIKIINSTNDGNQKIHLQQLIKSTKMLLLFLFAISLVRCTYNLFRCREEHGDCKDFQYNADNGGNAIDIDNVNSSKTSTRQQSYTAVVCIIIYTCLIRLYLRAAGNLTGYSINIFFVRYGAILASICVACHTLLNDYNVKIIESHYADSIVWIVYILLALQICIIIITPLMVHVVLPSENVTTFRIRSIDKMIPELFKKIKNLYGKSNESGEATYNDSIPIVYGLGTIYSSTIISVGTFITMVLLVLLGAKASIGMILCICIAALLLVIHSMIRFQTASNFEMCISPTFNGIAAWFLLANFCFFATSHQTTLSQIDWRAAFVGRTTSIGQSNIVSGLLVVLNTYCGQFLFFTTYSLLNIEGFSLIFLLPNLIQNNQKKKLSKNIESKLLNMRQQYRLETKTEGQTQQFDFDRSRGELVLFEREIIFLGSVFKLACQLFTLQGCKMFCSMLACTIHSRHLMVWKIFAPRFIYECIGTFATFFAIILGYVLVVRIHKAIDSLFAKIAETK